MLHTGAINLWTFRLFVSTERHESRSGGLPASTSQHSVQISGCAAHVLRQTGPSHAAACGRRGSLAARLPVELVHKHGSVVEQVEVDALLLHPGHDAQAQLLVALQRYPALQRLACHRTVAPACTHPRITSATILCVHQRRSSCLSVPCAPGPDDQHLEVVGRPSIDLLCEVQQEHGSNMPSPTSLLRRVCAKYA